jgi:hypothetical protein
MISERFTVKEAGVLAGAVAGRAPCCVTSSASCASCGPTGSCSTTTAPPGSGRCSTTGAVWGRGRRRGRPEDAAATIARELELGCHSVILHGAEPHEIAPMVNAYREIRPALARAVSVNPGLFA